MELTPLAVVLLFPIYTLFWAKRRLPPGESLWKKLISPTHNWGAIQCTCSNIPFTIQKINKGTTAICRFQE